jgi:alpha-tubulin suppressor-like RCC1 family protein
MLAKARVLFTFSALTLVLTCSCASEDEKGHSPELQADGGTIAPLATTSATSGGQGVSSGNDAGGDSTPSGVPAQQDVPGRDSPAGDGPPPAPTEAASNTPSNEAPAAGGAGAVPDESAGGTSGTGGSSSTPPQPQQNGGEAGVAGASGDPEPVPPEPFDCSVCGADEVCENRQCYAPCSGAALGCGDTATCCDAVCADTSLDPYNCGACGQSCFKDQVTDAACRDYGCEIIQCESPFGDCNDAWYDGCETDLSTDVDNCGECGNRCDLGTGCVSGACEDAAVVQISAGIDHTCVLRSNGRIVCWGSNVYGQLGTGTSSDRPEPPREVPGIADAIHIDAGYQYTCAVRHSGDVSCWGANRSSQLGSSNSSSSATPVAVGVEDAVRVSAGIDHVCAVQKTGSAVCWGANDYGQVGSGSSEPLVLGPTTVVGVLNAVDVLANGSSSLALLDDGTVLTWGSNSTGELGDGTHDDRFGPEPVLTGIGAVSASFGRACALRSSDGAPLCWGSNFNGPLGVGSTEGDVPLPTPLSNLPTLDGIDVSYGSACGYLAGQMWCWGVNRAGFLALPADVIEAAEPTPIALDGVTQLSLGAWHGCALRGPNDAPICWGDNSYQQLGWASPEGEEQFNPPTEVQLARWGG